MVKREMTTEAERSVRGLTTRWSPVVSLALIDIATLGSNEIIYPETKMLVGIRNPVTNITHPNVLSVPTQRVPARILQRVLKKKRNLEVAQIPSQACPEGLSEIYILNGGKVDNRAANGHNPTIYLVESILCRKLEMAAFLEKKQVSFISSPTALLIGNVLQEERGNNRSGKSIEGHQERSFQECIGMCNFTVLLSNADYVPRRSAGYSSLHWIQVQELMKIVEDKPPKCVIKSIGEQSIEYPSRGFCLLSAYISILHANRRL